MWNPLASWFRHREEMQRLRTAEAAAPYQALIAVTQQQNAVMMEWLSGFKSTAVPVTTVVRERDEWEAEQKREEDAGKQEPAWTAVDPRSLFPNL